MKATGIVRRIDDLGRVVIPKEIRRTMRIREGDPLEIYTDTDGEVIFKKYSLIGELSPFAGQYAEVIYKSTGAPTIVCDKDHVIAVAGLPKREALERRISHALEQVLESRKDYTAERNAENMIPVEGLDRAALVACPIISMGDVVGAVILLANENKSVPTETETKLTQVAAAFLGKQMDE